MPSILPDYEYDIFISYRHNDNRSGWVTEFVNALQEELASTIKEPLSIYFDKNPHDGLLETHNVDKSLEGKLKCLIFIPIISQTYCDPKSFAWQHEFRAFNKLSQEDELGREIKLSNGNVASRILPIKIHDLDMEDTNTIENEIGGVLRSIEFIYKEAGVNRPLNVDDNKNDNQNKTDYRNQINKVANALKDMGVALVRKEQGEEEAVTKENQIQTPSQKKTQPAYLRYWLIALLVVVLVGLGYWWFGSNPAQAAKVNAADKSLAILPFKNLSGKAEHDFLSYALKDEVHQSLSLGRYFAFMSSMQATFPYAQTDKTLTQIGDELGVDYVLSGFYQVLDDQIKITVELAEAETGFSIWTFPTTLKYNDKDVIALQKQIAKQVMSYFDSDNKDVVEEQLINDGLNFEAYQHYVKGLELTTKGHVLQSIVEFEKAIALDSTHVEAWINLVKQKAFYVWTAHKNDPSYYPEFNKHIQYIENNLPPWVEQLSLGIYEYHVLGNYDKGLSSFEELQNIYPDNEHINLYLWAIYSRKLKLQQSVDCITKTIKSNPMVAEYWTFLGASFVENGEYEEALLAVNNAIELGYERNYRYLYYLAGYSIDELPQVIKHPTTKIDIINFTWCFKPSSVLLQTLDTIEHDSVPGVDKYSLTQLYGDKAHIFNNLEQDDSMRNYANKCIIQNEKQEKKHWHSVINSYALMGNIDKAIQLMEEHRTFDDEDLSQATRRHKWKIELHVSAKEYKKATELLNQLNIDFPNYGDYADFNHWTYDRAKKEYPLFKEALDNLKLPPPLLTRIKMDRSKL